MEHEFLAALRKHFQAEIEEDLEKTLDTLTDDVVYESPFTGLRHVGKAGMDDYYRHQWSIAGGRKIDIARHWIAGDEVIVELRCDVVLKPNKGANTGPEPIVRKALAILKLRGGRIAREIIYHSDMAVVGSQWKRAD